MLEENKYKEYFPIIEENKLYLDFLLQNINQYKKIEDKLPWADNALYYAVRNNTGCFVSAVLENVYLDYAECIDIDSYNIKYENNSFLHVLTEGYTTGGHTRVVERWIKNAPVNQKHSVVILRPNSSALTVLEKNVKEKNGKYILFNNNLNLKEKAKKLRKIGMEYEYIVLHTHMEDPVATVAFGTEKFSRPVLFYNHASHLFWIGKSITDLHLDLQRQDIVTEKYRNIKNTYFLGIPMQEVQFKVVDKLAIRKELGFPVDKKIIISAGANFKYKSLGEDDFVKLIKGLIDKETFVYVIGADKNDPMWIKAQEETDKHIIPLGYIDFNNGYLDYIGMADLYIDSYPMNGWTAVIDAISVNVPAISLRNLLPQMDFLETTGCCFKKKLEFIECAKRILSDKEYADKIVFKTKQALEVAASTETWNSKIEDMLKKVPAIHSVKRQGAEKDFCLSNDLSVINNLQTNGLRPLRFPKKYMEKYIKYGLVFGYQKKSFIEIISFKKNNIKFKLIIILGRKIFCFKYIETPKFIRKIHDKIFRLT